MGTKLYNLPHVVELLPPASVTADGNGAWIDTKLYEGVLGFIIHAKNTAGTTPTLANKLVHSEDQSTVEDVPGGTFTTVTDANTLASVVEKVEIQKNALKRYVRVAKDIGGTSSPAFLTSGVMVGHKKYDT